MELSRFSLGVRLKLNTAEPTKSEIIAAVKKVLRPLHAEDTDGTGLYISRSKLLPIDGDDILTVIFTRGGLKQMRRLYSVLRQDPMLLCSLVTSRPYIQTNALSRLDDAEYLGEFGSDGMLKGGDLAVQLPEKRKYSRSEGGKLRIVLAPDKFKGSLTAEEAIAAIAEAARRILPGSTIHPLPMADGGDGTADIIVRTFGGVKYACTVTGPLGEPVAAEYGMVGGNTAVIEMAAASGLALINEKDRDIMRASSFGTGELVLDALSRGAKHIVLCLGGSATNDGGMGAAAALGVRFFDAEGNILAGCGADTERVVRIDTELVCEKLKNADIKLFCDVSNPMTGEKGAANTFAPQKGAGENELRVLESGMKNLEKLFNSFAGRDIGSVPGSGAAGGIAAMFIALFGAEIVSGADTMLRINEFDKLLKKTDLVITGEGCFDKTGMGNGKAVDAVISHARKQRVPVVVIAGSSEAEADTDSCEVICLIEEGMTKQYAMEHASELLERKAEELFVRIGKNGGNYCKK